MTVVLVVVVVVVFFCFFYYFFVVVVVLFNELAIAPDQRVAHGARIEDLAVLDRLGEGGVGRHQDARLDELERTGSMRETLVEFVELLELLDALTHRLQRRRRTRVRQNVLLHERLAIRPLAQLSFQQISNLFCCCCCCRL